MFNKLFLLAVTLTTAHCGPYGGPIVHGYDHTGTYPPAPQYGQGGYPPVGLSQPVGLVQYQQIQQQAQQISLPAGAASTTQYTLINQPIRYLTQASMQVGVQEKPAQKASYGEQSAEAPPAAPAPAPASAYQAPQAPAQQYQTQSVQQQQYPASAAAAQSQSQPPPPQPPQLSMPLSNYLTLPASNLLSQLGLTSPSQVSEPPQDPQQWSSEVGGASYSPGSGSEAPGHNAAVISSSRSLTLQHLPPPNEASEPTNVYIDAPVNPVNLVYRSSSSPVTVQNVHQGNTGNFQETSSVDAPHHYRHTVTKPVIQELHEVIAPYRRVVQQIQPVKEEVQTAIAVSKTQGLRRAPPHYARPGPSHPPQAAAGPMGHHPGGPQYAVDEHAAAYGGLQAAQSRAMAYYLRGGRA